MKDIQEYFNKQFSDKNLNLINFKNEGLDFQGKELIIENYPKLEFLVVQEFSVLKKLTIKDCKNLSSIELYSNREIEVNLQGEFPNLSSWKIFNTPQTVFINTPKKQTFCWKCLFFALIIIWNITLTIWLYKGWIKKKVKK